MNTGFNFTRCRSPNELARFAKPDPSALFTIARGYESSAIAELFEALVLHLDRHVQGLVRKVRVLLLTPNFLEKCLEACPAAKSTEPPLDSIYSPFRHRVLDPFPVGATVSLVVTLPLSANVNGDVSGTPKTLTALNLRLLRTHVNIATSGSHGFHALQVP
jgi:hypothetical protein